MLCPLVLAGAVASVFAQSGGGSCTSGTVQQFGGIVPSLAVTADSAPVVPAGLPKRSESGVGALMPWADRLFMISYLSVPNYGSGTGLYSIDPELKMEKIANHTSVFANRMIHHWTDQIVIGPYVIDAQRNVRVISALLNIRIGAMAEHLMHPEDMVYMVSMDGPFFEVNLTSLQATLLFNLTDVLNIPISPDPHTTGQCYPHFKDALTVHTNTDGKGGILSPGGVVYVASNGYNEKDYTSGSYCGRLASWDGKSWTILQQTAFYGLAARKNYGRMVYASGWDDKSAILMAKDQGSPDAPSVNEAWTTYRLPKASHAFDHGWQTEWPRIREVETERYLLDVHGMFYELSPLGWQASNFGVRPISQHLRVVPDFASFRGMLVMGGNEVSSIFDNNVVTGQSQSGLWLGKTDDLWSWGKPQGWGSVWKDTTVYDEMHSDPFLMTGFDKKVLHVSMDGDLRGNDISVDVQLDPVGDAMQTGKWRHFTSLDLSDANFFTTAYVFPVGLSAHWVRLYVDMGVPFGGPHNITATFIYT